MPFGSVPVHSGSGCPHEFALYSDTRACVAWCTLSRSRLLRSSRIESLSNHFGTPWIVNLPNGNTVPAAKDSWWIGTTVNDTGVLLSMIVAKSRSVANVLAREDDDS